MRINFMSSKDSDETRTMYTKSDNRETMTGRKPNEIIAKFFESLLQRYPKELKEKLRGSKFVLDSSIY